ncbi:hypothetical protein [Kitasatospora sp. NRRL B-11411]|uniref:hypothetical protein n=1 Tax=Kitasatospora sp. NRRL B-11411 TaxID=1463822 RepID=UPI0004C46FCD|nr:hypothetical protein [Kitasatospora sp. NRRL B-11411]
MKTLNPLEPNPRLRYDYDRGSGYENEIRLTEALSALVPTDLLIHPDHRLFQVVHLITEYAWAGIHHTLCDAVAALDDGDLVETGRLLRRATELGAVPVSCLRLLVDFLPQSSFLKMRELFPYNSTGLDSPGVRGIRKAAHALWESFESALSAHGMRVADLGPAAEPGWRGETGQALLADVGLALHRFDSRTTEWRQVHLAMVWQLLGGRPLAEEHAEGRGRPTSMRGRPLSDLERLAVRPLFPKLWLDSTARYRAFTDAGGSTGEARGAESAGCPMGGRARIGVQAA